MYLLLSSVLWAALLIILEQGNCWFHFAEDNSHQESSVPVEELDDDVTEEKQRVENETENGIHFNENGIRCYKLKKVYEEEKGNVVAVRELSVDIQPSEVFALLGVNGAGKSTTLKMLTGNTQPTSGHGTLLSYDIQQHKDLALSTLGYCPQTDGLFDLLTGKVVVLRLIRFLIYSCKLVLLPLRRRSPILLCMATRFAPNRKAEAGAECS